MKYMYLCLGFIMAGIIGISFIVLFQNVTVNNESEYYVLKEAMEAAMLESIDMQCYRRSNVPDNSDDECGNGKIKISEQKFVENFTRRFTESISGNAQNFELEFFDIIESPPKATVVVKASTDGGALEQTFSIVNELDGILEFDKELMGGLNIEELGEELNQDDIEIKSEELQNNNEISEGEVFTSQSGEKLDNNEKQEIEQLGEDQIIGEFNEASEESAQPSANETISENQDKQLETTE